MDSKKKISRWYFGGVASAMAACITHPLDLLKVHLQTQQEGKISIFQTTANIVRKQGVTALYNGISASITRQMTYSMTRFAIYDVMKQTMSSQGTEPNFAAKVGMAAFAGAAGGFIGTPPDMVNVRMQNDVKLPAESRRNYKHVFDGLWRVYRNEGLTKLFSGASMATTRAIMMTVGQLSFYDQIKSLLLDLPYFDDNANTHFVASLSAGAIATTLTQPLDVLKTRAMNAKPGEFANLGALIIHTAKLGPLGFFKGYVPAFVRLGPHTVLTFMFLEQLRINFGFFAVEKK